MATDGGEMCGGAKWALSVGDYSYSQRDLGDVRRFGVEHVFISDVAKNIAIKPAGEHIGHLGSLETTKRKDTCFWRDNLRQMFFRLLVQQTPRLYEPGWRSCTSNQEAQLARAGVAAIGESSLHAKKFPYSRILISRPNGNNISMNKCALANNKGIMGSYSLFTGIISSKSGRYSGSYNEEKRNNIQPMFGFGLGAGLIAFGASLGMIAARHRGPLFFVLAITIFIGAW